MSEAIISLKNVTKKFKDAVVLNDVSAEFLPGMIHGIVGRNGCGKTIMFKCILNFMRATDGEIFVRGKQVKKDFIPQNIGTIIESPGFLPNYSGYKNLSLLAQINGKIGKADIKNALCAVGLDPDSKKHVKKYSMGMRQRLGIAQAIMEDPDILILDEPFNGLDNTGVQDMRKLFSDLRTAGKTILLTSHNSEDIDRLCDYVYEMDKGRIINVENRTIAK